VYSEVDLWMFVLLVFIRYGTLVHVQINITVIKAVLFQVSYKDIKASLLHGLFNSAQFDKPETHHEMRYSERELSFTTILYAH